MDRHLRRPEQALQRAVVQFIALTVPDTLFWTAINPVPGKSPATAAISKAMGMRAGVADLLLIWEGFPFFIEFKSERGRDSPAQREMSALAARAGTPTYVCRSLDDVVRVFAAKGIPMRGGIRFAA